MKLKTVLFILILSSSVVAQQTALDWKLHNIGKVRQLITNFGSLWYGGIVNYTGLIYCEYPPQSHEEHIGEGGIWVGAILDKDTLVSCTTSWNSWFEFYPSAARWDTIWVVNKGLTVDIPYWPNYTAVSDQDLVCRYSDYNITNITAHQPLFVDVIQTSYAWSSPPLDEMIIYNFYVIPTRYDLKDVYIAYWLDGNVGYRGSGWGFALDDYSVYYHELKMGVAIDFPGYEDGEAISPIGIKIYPPSKVPADALRWTFNWYPGQGMGAPPSRDSERYAQMAQGIIMQNQTEPIGSQFIISFGPFNLNRGDTLHFKVGEILGEGLKGMMRNVERLDWLVSRNFRVPAPPPLPPLRIRTDSRRVELNWKAQPGDVDPETYQDPGRADNVAQPFEGYRVYKSTQSIAGPWTLLAEYDIPGNQFGQNTGLDYQYVDVGLLNNLDYFYTVTAFSKPDTAMDFPSQESSKTANARRVVPGTAPPQSVGEVAVVPNPYRGDFAYNTYNPPWEKPSATRDRWMEQDRRVQFINLPEKCEIKIYTLAGDLLYSISHDNPELGYEDWNLTSYVGQAISSGIYLFSVEDKKSGKIQVGKFVVIK
ncbi:MAG: hypothetical protein ONB31_07170 [candidate division KSB1 bacterium]|nr:hypothetical protein [candidate division KSB1 bacterium]MDZ7334372.1 hypothetical protein [candidate division KSB1 bacterium]MDZ7358782.1 hypothetical protein [candidate division KSB1 bacterium]MDZ7399279.1 hypothetical protein [candidate division KSB1 bacterium]